MRIIWRTRSSYKIFLQPQLIMTIPRNFENLTMSVKFQFVLLFLLGPFSLHTTHSSTLDQVIADLNASIADLQVIL